MRMRRLPALVVAGLALAALTPGPAEANHKWARYHWARQTNPFTIPLGNNVGSGWTTYLNEASTDWSRSTVLDTAVVAGSTSGSACKPKAGRVEVCTSNYGQTDWLGIAQIWLTTGRHIAQGTVQNNDYYFNQERYNTASWRRFVMCQEIGHTFGLGHVNENFGDANTGSCMDYTNDPSGTKNTNGTLNNEHPNQHDYDMLASIYGHADGFNSMGAATAQQASAGAASSQAQWGQALRYSSDGRPVVFERDLGNGERLVTFVIWAR